MSRSGGAFAGALVAAAATFVFRFLTVEFTNDHFIHLSRAFQIVQGEVPVRDFFDPGLFLQYYASAAALRWSGHNLLGESILTSAFIALGAALTYFAAFRLSRSHWMSAVATALGVFAMPRLYGYPKVVFYALAIVGAWRYACAPGTASRLMLAAITALAFLFRYDHGVYIALATVVLLAVRHWGALRPALMAVANYGVATLVLLSPFLIFLQMTTGLLQQASGAGRDVAAFRVIRMPFEFDSRAPLVAFVAPSGPRVNIRWAPNIDSATRQRLEKKHALLAPQLIEGTTWSYVLSYEDPAHLGAIVLDPAVVDTHGINRAEGRLESATPPYVTLQHRLPFLRIRLAPGVFTGGNALAWFYYVTLLLPAIGLVLLVARWRHRSVDQAEAAVVAMGCVLNLIIVQTLVRGSPDSRLADIANPTFIVGAWVAGTVLRSIRGRRLRWRVATVAVLGASLVTLWSAYTSAEVASPLESTRVLLGPRAVWQRAKQVVEQLHERPIDRWSVSAPGLGGLIRYAFECTGPNDRVLATWFAPQVPFYAERRFAGGQVALVRYWHATEPEQRLTVERLSHQRVPIVIDSAESNVDTYFPLVGEYLRQRYQRIVLPGAPMEGYSVLIDRGVAPTRSYEPLGLPCYR